MPGKHSTNWEPEPLLLFVLEGLTVEPRLALTHNSVPSSWVLEITPGLHLHIQPLNVICNQSWTSGHWGVPALVSINRKFCLPKDVPFLSLNFHLDFVSKAPGSPSQCHHIPTLSVSSASFLHSPLAKHTLHSHLYHLPSKDTATIKTLRWLRLTSNHISRILCLLLF